MGALTRVQGVVTLYRMDEVANVTVLILREIRDELKATRRDLTERIDQTNARLDETNARLDVTIARLDVTNTRLDSHEKVLLRLVDVVERMDGRVERLDGRVERLEGRLENFITGTHREDHEALRRRVDRLEALAGVRREDA